MPVLLRNVGGRVNVAAREPPFWAAAWSSAPSVMPQPNGRYVPQRRALRAHMPGRRCDGVLP